MKLSPLERAILTKYHEAYARDGFPKPDEIDVLTRENSGAGRFVDLDGPLTSIVTHACGLLEEIIVEMEGVEQGLGFVLFIEEGRLDMLELYTYGDNWDGEERAWRFVATGPSTGLANA